MGQSFGPYRRRSRLNLSPLNVSGRKSGLIPKGKIHAAALPVAAGLPFLKKVLPETQCKGDFGIEGAFDEKGIELHVDIPRLSVSTPLIAVELLPPKEKRAQGVLTASWESEDFRFLLPLSDAKCALPAFGLTFSHVRAWLELDKRQVNLKDLHAICEGIALQGQLHIDSRGVSLHTDKILGKIEDLEIVFAKATRYKYRPLGISGDFTSGPEGLIYEAPLRRFEHMLRCLSSKRRYLPYACLLPAVALCTRSPPRSATIRASMHSN